MLMQMSQLCQFQRGILSILSDSTTAIPDCDGNLDILDVFPAGAAALQTLVLSLLLKRKGDLRAWTDAMALPFVSLIKPLYWPWFSFDLHFFSCLTWHRGCKVDESTQIPHHFDHML